MPEYLAPGVYVEEVPSGNKPIEGVSTSTAGFVGVTERGPVNEPTLVTSYGAFTQVFGGYLDHRIFTSDRDVLPYAVEGFFMNGGTRAYITRVIGTNAVSAEVDLFGFPTGGGAKTTTTAAAALGATTLALASAADIAQNDFLLLEDGTRSEYVKVTGVGPLVIEALKFAHPSGINVVEQVPLLRAHARHPGQWGNSLRVRIAPTSVLETTVAEAADVGAPGVKLAAIFGLGAGSVLNFKRGDPLTDILRKRVTGVDPATNQVTLDGGVTAALQKNDVATSAEFDLIVERLDANGKVLESEAFSGLGVDAAHTGYAPRVVGAFNRATGKAEEAGASELIRVSDRTKKDDGTDETGAAALRLAVPYDKVNRTMAGGDDKLSAITDTVYIGATSIDPESRTGIHAMENIEELGIVAAPGRTSQEVQNALIAHCALMRYRFAVLDAGEGDKLKEVQKLRQNYDTTYAALYYPWMIIADPFGRNGDIRYIPPSGHVVGIYARCDTQRGVHKAPANEVILGPRDLQVRLTKGEQDILNPRHVNCLRDFRDMNRGLRVWGARTLSSDPEWKYINVRRLFLFVEKSLERGLQWAVFEPNAEPLWATVKRSITNFLIAVWRDGALEGTKPDEAFFVDVGLSTMTQSDIDNGRLIIRIGLAPVKPAEFVVIRISQKTREATA